MGCSDKESEEKPQVLNGNLANRQKSEVEDLLAQIAKVNKEIESFGCSEEKLRDERMEILHKYNNVKDATQIIIGQLADFNGVSFKSIHKEYKLPMDE